MKRLGQFLVELGWITEDNLARALESKQARGARLGTCLLELELISEELLLKALSHQLGVGAAEVRDLRNIPPEVYHLIPGKVAVRCQAIPFRMLGGELYVAMLEVHNLSFHDEISFVSGKSVRPYIGNEARIFEALDRYYGATCPQRFNKLLTKLDQDGDKIAAAQTSPFDTATATPSEQRGETSVAIDTVTDSDPERTHRIPTLRALPPLPEARTSVTLEAGGEPPTASAPVARAKEQPYDTQGVARGEPLSYPELQSELAVPQDRDHVGSVVLRYLNASFRRIALFMVRRNEVRGWMGLHVDEAVLGSFRLDFKQPSVFLNLREGGLFFLGPLPPMRAHEELAQCWGGELPDECLVLPVRLQDRLVSLIYVDRGSDGLASVDLDQMQQVAGAMASSLERCILKKKHRKN